MPESLITTVGGMPSPFAVRVLDEASARLGQREVGNNQGKIVQEVCAPFLSEHRFAELYAAGKLEWCAGFACYCWWKADPSFRPLVSLSCADLWAHHGAAAFLKGARPPAPGDMIFFIHTQGEHRGTIRHVGIVERYDAAVERIDTIEGNARGEGDSGGVRRKHYYLSDPAVYGFAHREGT